MDDRVNKVRLTLWDITILQLGDDIVFDDSTPIIAIVTSTTVKQFKGNFNLHTRCIFNVDCRLLA